jgi:peptidoglycan/xylan/chitin deacetylase (PgdA/CDA1 family)
MTGLFVISLDFELFWGVRDKRTLGEYRENLLGVRAAVPALLALFERFGVRATWATVGFLFCDGRADVERWAPARRPRYRNAHLSPYSVLSTLGSSEEADPFHFAPSLLRKIAAHPSQEIGCHTFSHFYCLEDGQDEGDFEADLDAAQAIAREKLGRELVSLVFPRNQFNERHLGVAVRAGFRAYRGNQASWLYGARAEGEERLVRRGLRLLDSYLPLSGTNVHDPAAVAGDGAVNVPASRFLRPHSHRLAHLDELRAKRILKDMEQAAASGAVYHLWWHPHNFGRNLEQNLAFLCRILRRYAELAEQGRLRSATMAEVAALSVRSAA